MHDQPTVRQLASEIQRLKRQLAEFSFALETIEILNAPEALKRIRQSEEDILAGRVRRVDTAAGI